MIKQTHAGFTLIEVMLALSLGMMIILIGTTAFHAITETMRSVSKLHYQNEQLRSGWWSTLRSVDYWDNEASPDAPYFRLHNRHKRANSSDDRKALFTPILFTKKQGVDFGASDDPLEFLTGNAGTDPALHPMQNPNVLLPHDPRSWYRNHLWASAKPGSLQYSHGNNWGNDKKLIVKSKWDNGTWVPGTTPGFTIGDYALTAATDMSANHYGERFERLDWNGDSVINFDDAYLGGNDPYDRSITAGTWSSADDGDIVEDGIWNVNSQHSHHLDRELDLDWQLTASTRPRLMWQLFQRLGHTGSSRYMPNGSFVVLADQNGDWPNSTSAPYYDRTNPADGHDYHEAHNSFIGYPARQARKPSDPRPEPFVDLHEHVVGKGASDWEHILGFHYDKRSTGFAMLPTQKKDMLSGIKGYYSKWDLLNFTPFRGTTTLGGDGSIVGSTLPSFLDLGGDNHSGQFIFDHPTLTSRTIRVPYNIADAERAGLAPDFITDLQELNVIDDSLTIDGWRAKIRVLDLENKPDHLPTLTTGFLRMQGYSGGDMNIATVQVDDPDGKHVILRFNALGTTFRGARQHWAQQHLRNRGTATDNDEDGNPPIGDFYERE